MIQRLFKGGQMKHARADEPNGLVLFAAATIVAVLVAWVVDWLT